MPNSPLKFGIGLLVAALSLTATVSAEPSERFGVIVLTATKGEQRPLVDKIKAVREQLKIAKSEMPVAEIVWDNPIHRKAIELTLGLKEHQLPLATTGEVASSGMPLAANRHRPALGLPHEVIAYYLVNEWARRADKPPFYFPYHKTASKLEVSSDEQLNRDGTSLVLVPAGSFWMGSTEGEIDELPPRQIQLPSYYIGKTEVTVGQFRKFVEATGYVTEAETRGFGFVWDETWNRVDGAKWSDPAGNGTRNDDDFPVRQVSLADCVAYCEWAEARLPTEAEWEKAARGPSGQQYPWGNGWSESRVVYKGLGPEHVGSLLSGRSPYGILDMAGNVREWTQSLYEPYSPVIEQVKSGERYSVRGGSWAESQPKHLRVCYRFNSLAAVFNDRTGFRIAKDHDNALGFSNWSRLLSFESLKFSF